MIGFKSLRQALLAGVAAFAGTALVTTTARPAYAQEATRTYNIQPQDLNAALREFAIQTGRDVLYPPDIVAGKRSQGAQGQLTERQALDALLAGTGLRFTQTASNGYAVQDPASPTQLGAGDQLGPVDEEEIVVTGTNLKGQAPVGSPLITFGREEIDQSGAATVDQFFRLVPQNFGNIDPSSANTLRFTPAGPEANQNTGLGSTPNIHGVGLGATLALVDGRRLSPGGVTGSVVDVSVIPLAAIERVEILADGASAIYGADAVAGVVNFVLREDFDGAQSSARYGLTTQGGGAELDINQLVGANWRTGNAFASYSFTNREDIAASERDFVTTSPTGARGGFTLFPEQTTHSGLVSLRQELSSDIDLRLLANIADRTTRYSDAFGTTVEANEIDQLDYGIGATLTARLPWGWQLDAEGQYYRSYLDFDTVRTTGNFSLSSETELLSGDLRIQGSLFTLPGGEVRGLIGGSVRYETYTLDRPPSQFIDGSRTVESVYTEVLVPIIGPENALPFIHSLTVSLAGRYDAYPGFGSTTNPKIGIDWGVSPDLALRASYGTSFRPPGLYQSVPVPEFAYVFSLTDPSVGGNSIALIRDFGTSESLEPEESESYSAGFDYQPRSIPGLDLSFTYFDVAYTNRIGRPPLAGGTLGILAQPELADIVDRSPTLSEVQALIDAAVAAGTYFDFSGPGFSNGNRTAADIQVVANIGIQNTAATQIRGLDLNASYAFELGGGEASISVGLAQLLELRRQNTAGGAYNDGAGVVFSSPDLRVRLVGGWTRGDFSTSLSLNHTNPFDNPYVTPTGRVDAYQTVDWQLGYELGQRESPQEPGTRFTLSISNLFDEEPPVVLNPANPRNLGFDPSNASARGRFVAFQVTKNW